MLAVMLANKTPAGAVLSCLNSHSPYCIRVIHHHLRSPIPSVQGNPHIAGLLLQMVNDKFEPGSLLLWQLCPAKLNTSLHSLGSMYSGIHLKSMLSTR